MHVLYISLSLSFFLWNYLHYSYINYTRYLIICIRSESYVRVIFKLDPGQRSERTKKKYTYCSCIKLIYILKSKCYLTTDLLWKLVEKFLYFLVFIILSFFISLFDFLYGHVNIFLICINKCLFWWKTDQFFLKFLIKTRLYITLNIVYIKTYYPHVFQLLVFFNIFNDKRTICDLSGKSVDGKTFEFWNENVKSLITLQIKPEKTKVLRPRLG